VGLLFSALIRYHINMKKFINKSLWFLSLILIFVSVIVLTGCGVKTPETAASLVAAGDQLFNEQEYSAALVNYQTAIGLDSTFIPAYQASSKVLQLRRNFSAALTNVTEGLVTNPNNLELLLLQGEIYLKQNDYPNAQAVYEAILIISPGEERAILGKIEALILAGKISDAQTMTIGITKTTNTPRLFLLAIALNSDNSEKTNFFLTELESRSNPDYQKIVEKMRAELFKMQVTENRLAAIAEMANFLLQYQETTAAIPFIQQLITINEYYEIGHVYKAIVLMDHGFNSEAVSELEKALSLKPDLLETRIYLLEAYLANGNQEKAQTLLDDSLDYFSLERVNELKALINILIDYRKFDQAAKVLDYYKNLNPAEFTDLDLQVAVVEVNTSLNNQTMAIASAEALLVDTNQLSREAKVKLYTYYGYALYLNNEKARALEWLKKAESIDNSFADNFYFQAVIYLNQQKYIEADRAIQRASDLDLSGKLQVEKLKI